jgi:hypothetical protein
MRIIPKRTRWGWLIINSVSEGRAMAESLRQRLASRGYTHILAAFKHPTQDKVAIFVPEHLADSLSDSERTGWQEELTADWRRVESFYQRSI